MSFSLTISHFVEMRHDLTEVQQGDGVLVLFNQDERAVLLIQKEWSIF